MLDDAGVDYKKPSLENVPVHKAATANFNALLGRIATQLIKDGDKVMVAFGSCGRSTLEIIKKHKNLKVDLTDPSCNNM